MCDRGVYSGKQRGEEVDSETGDGGRRFIVPQSVEKVDSTAKGLRIMVVLPKSW